MPTTSPMAIPTSMTPKVCGASTCSKEERRTSITIHCRGGCGWSGAARKGRWRAADGGRRNGAVGQRKAGIAEQVFPFGHRLPHQLRSRLGDAREGVDLLEGAAGVDERPRVVRHG